MNPSPRFRFGLRLSMLISCGVALAGLADPPATATAADDVEALLPGLTETRQASPGAGSEIRADGQGKGEANDGMPASFNPDRHLAVADVQPGMRGYGLTVFQGTEPEPFAVEVVSVERGFMPGKAVVWVRCLDERMQKTGPVSGMSGSPIFLWDDSRDGDWSDLAEALKRGEDGEPITTVDLPRLDVAAGEAVPTGRMLGAFAFGFSFGKDCYVGIQPIEQMLAAGERAKAPEVGSGPSDGAAAEVGAGGSTPDLAARQLGAARRAAERRNLPESHRWRLERLAEVMDVTRPAPEPEPQAEAGSRQHPMYLPVRVGSAEQAAWLTPFLKPAGLMPVSGNGAGGQPPDWIDAEAVTFEPGGVASVPLVSGDMDLPAVGTVTEVLPDGTVLAFGHAFLGQGEVNVPMATGYVHFIQPSVMTSFKLGGSLRTRGAIVNDESTAIVGKQEVQHDFRPATVHVKWPDASKNHTYEYQLTNHPMYLPVFAAMTVGMSVTSDTALPENSSMRLSSTIDFGERQLTVQRILPFAYAGAATYELTGPMVTLAENRFGRMPVRSIETTVEVIPKVLQATVEQVAVKKSVVAPGEDVVIDLTFHPFRGERFAHQARFPIPADTPEGRYTLLVGSSQMYMNHRMETRPHLGRVRNQSDLFELVKTMYTLPDDALYMALTSQQRRETAIRRSELPDLPSSRAAMLQTPRNSDVTTYATTEEKTTDLPWVIDGGTYLDIEVRKRPVAPGRGGEGDRRPIQRPGDGPIRDEPADAPDVPIEPQFQPASPRSMMK